MKLTCAALLFLVAAGCGCKEGAQEGDAPDAVARLDDRHTLAAPVTVGNLTVWPVLTDKPLDLGEFLTLDEALAKGSAEVREAGAPGAAQEAQVHFGEPQREAVESDSEPPAPAEVTPAEDASQEGDSRTEVTRFVRRDEAVEAQTLTQVLQSLDGAVVNTLVIENKGDLPILVCAGTVVKGGNQDRQIGQDFVLKAHSTTPVDAFCVEQGRWQSGRMGVDTGGKFQVLDGMATAKIRAKGQYEKDQGGVWQEVAAVASIATTGEGRVMEQNASTSYAVAFDANAASSDDLKGVEDAVRKHFRARAGAVGFAYAVNGEPVAVRTFAHPRLLGKQFDDFVRAMATESLLAKDAPGKPASAADVVALVKSISAADEKVAETQGLNRNGIRANEAGYNGTCYVADADGRLAPLTQDWTRK